MKKRLRDWPVLTYKYGVYLPDSSTPPPILADEAIAMRDLWNDLVARDAVKTTRYREILAESSALADAQALLAQRQATYDEATAALRASRQQARKRKTVDATILTDAITRARSALREVYALEKSARAAAKEMQREKIAALHADYDAEVRHLRANTSTVYSSNREFILDRFATASRMAKKSGRQLSPQPGFPNEINYAHLFTAGWPVERIFAGASTRVGFKEQRNAERCAQSRQARPQYRFDFNVRGQQLPLTVFYHRPLPTDCLIKSVVLHGKRVRRPGYTWSHITKQRYRINARWEWSLLITCEIPHPPTVEIPTLACGIDVGYRLRPNGGLRVAYLVDGSGHEEELQLPKKMLDQLRHQWETQAAGDTLREEALEALKTIALPDDLPPEWRNRLQSGPLDHKHLSLLHQALLEASPSPLRSLLNRWATRSTWHYFEWRGARPRLIRWRRDLYRKWVLSLCQRYTHISIEDLDVKGLGEREKESLGHGEVGKYRAFAAVGELLMLIKQGAAKHHRIILLRDPAHTTSTCPSCGAQTETDRMNLRLVCTNGHSYDQDSGAAINLMASQA